MGVKTRSTYYTSEKVEAVRRNVTLYDWAKPFKEQAVEQAEVYVEMGWEQLWQLPTPQSIPRSYAVNQELGCPVCGEAHHAYGRWPWLADPLRQPWKLICPSCKSVFPSNDFASYYESGKDEHGLFRRELADPRYLINELYPERGPGWGVDDGHGWVDFETRKAAGAGQDKQEKQAEWRGDFWTFVAFYNHWKIWCPMIDAGGNQFPPTDAPWGHGGIAASAIGQLRDAYLYTGELKYAQAGVVLLDRIADLYPEMDCGVFRWEDGILNSHGLTGQGKVIGCIWETGLVRSFVSAYDAFYLALREERAAEMADVVAFLREKVSRYKLPAEKSSLAAITANIEDGIVRQVYPGVRKVQIHGNNGMHQSSLAMAAIVLDEPGTTEEMLDFVLQEGGLLRPEAGGWADTGGDILHSLLHDVDRDGFGDEAAPLYNNLWVDTFKLVADILQGYDRYPIADLYRHPKFRQMLRAHADLLMLRRYIPQIGDSDSAGNPNVLYKAEMAVDTFERTGEPVFAQLAVLANGGTVEGLRAGLFSLDPERVLRDMRQVLAERGLFHNASVHLGGYGFAALRDGGAGDVERAVWLYHGRNQGHGHKDTLNIGLYAFGLDLSPELGYPEKCDDVHQKTHHWDRSTVAHNTVTVDGSKQLNSVVGASRLFVDAGEVKVVEVEAPQVYAQTSVYRRCVVMVRLDETHSYAVDLFHVEGGEEHVYSFHGAEGAVRTEGLQLTAQAGGTYAGAHVAYGEPYDAVPGQRLREYAGSGFHYLTDVVRDEAPGSAFAVEWAIRDTWRVLGMPGDGEAGRTHEQAEAKAKGPAAGASAATAADTGVRLRLTMLTAADEVALADGHPSSNRPGNPERLRYMLAKRRPADGVSRFAAVLEPYREQARQLRDVRRCSVRCVGSAGDGGDDGAGFAAGAAGWSSAGGSTAGESTAEVTAVREEPHGGVSEVGVTAIRVERLDGRVDYIVHAADPSQVYLIDERVEFQGHVGVISERAGEPVYAFVANGSRIAWVAAGAAQPLIDGAPASLGGEILDFSRELAEANWLRVRFTGPLPASAAGHELTGRYVHAAGAGRNPVFRICGWTPSDADPCEAQLDIGAVTLIEGLEPAGPAAGGERPYRYAVAAGDTFTIPLSSEWRGYP
ncbi:heparinase II/III domain-containing protein [Paenibacillus koleovorans]|uniref:heparinase II/III domain-containing protein n=1 Tax=Paenibacillus koleovorans TaxID=121608 RepID=UPI000FDA3E37|nr:heparinase II/III family protein [Paenibacillus koleovorans]